MPLTRPLPSRILLTRPRSLLCAADQALVPERSRGQLKHLDQVEADYGAHLAEIDSKLTLIIGGACEAQLNKWEARPPVPSQQFRSVPPQNGVTSRHLYVLCSRCYQPILQTFRRRRQIDARIRICCRFRFDIGYITMIELSYSKSKNCESLPLTYNGSDLFLNV